MSVLIKGMEMPTSCGNCFFDTRCDNWRLRNWGAPPPDDCPLVPVPPHGDLIDRGALKPYMLNEHYRYRRVYDADEVAINMISLNESREVVGGHNIKIICDCLLEDTLLGEGVVIPGGIPGVPNIEKNVFAVDFIKEHYNDNKLVAAICAAPSLLGRAGLLEEKKAVCYPDLMDELLCKEKFDQNVVVDGNVITSKSAGTALDFAFEIIKYLKDEKVAENVKNSIFYNN